METMMNEEDKPSYQAQEIMARIVAGERVTLSEREVSRLSEYELPCHR